jgi:hypothetical protein
MRRGDGAVSGPFSGCKRGRLDQEGERGKKPLLRGQKQKSDQEEVLFLERIFSHSFRM